MLENQKAWKREAGFERIEIITEMDAQRFRTDFDSEPLYTKLYNPRWPHTPAENTLEFNVEVEGLRKEILLSQPALSPQDDLSPRQSPAVGTGLNEPGIPHAESQSTEREEIFPSQASLDVFLHVSCIRNRRLLFCFKQTSERTTKQQLQNYKPPLARSLRDCRLAGNNERRLRPSKASSLTLEGEGGAITFRRDGCLFSLFFSFRFLDFSVFLLVCIFFKQAREARRIFNQGWERLGRANQMHELLYQDRSAHLHLDLHQRYTLYHVFPLARLMISNGVFRYSLHSFEIIGSFGTN